MCFSPEASFTSAAVLVPTGAYSLWLAGRRASRLWPLAVVPVLFGVQQVSEGFVWLGLRTGNQQMTAWAAGAFLFFAYAFWPFWFSAGTAIMEPEAARKRLLIVCSLISTCWFWLYYLPIIKAAGGVAVHIDHHSIRYDYADDSALVTCLLYCITAVVPVALSSLWRVLVLPLVLAIVSAAVTVVIFEYAFTSVWCLFAALLSVVVLYEIATYKSQPDSTFSS